MTRCKYWLGKEDRDELEVRTAQAADGLLQQVQAYLPCIAQYCPDIACQGSADPDVISVDHRLKDKFDLL